MITQLPVLIFLTAFLSALLTPLAGRMKSARSHRFATLALCITTSLAVWALAVTVKGQVYFYSFGGWEPPFGIQWRLDPLAALMLVLVTGLALTTVSATFRPQCEEIGEAKGTYYMTVLLLISGLIGMILTNDLFNLFVFLEISSLAGYALIGAGNNRHAAYASLRYLFLGSIGASLYLLGIGYLYAATGTLNMTDMAARLPEVAFSTRTVPTGVLLIFLGFAIKMGLFPFHGWLPDAYTYSSNSVTSLIAPIFTKVALYAMIRISFWVLGPAILETFHIFTLLRGFGLTAILIGSVMAFFQTNLKRLLAYSSIAHIGLIAAGTGLQDPTALSGALMHILNHAVMKGCLFLIAASLFSSYGITRIDELAKMRGKSRLTLAFFAIVSLSMIGIPPLSGFFSKWYILAGALNKSDFLAGIIIAGSSLLSALYLFRVIEKAFLKSTAAVPSSSPQHVMPGDSEGALSTPPRPLTFAIGFLTSVTLLLGLLGPQIFAWIRLAILPEAG